MGELIEVGTFQLGLHNIRLFADPDSTGGHVNLRPEDHGLPRIVVGVDDQNWSDIQATLLHEAYEAVMIDLGTRYSQRPSFSDESSNYIFLLTHNQLDEAHTRVSWFFTKAVPPFKKVYHKAWRDKRAAERKKKNENLDNNGHAPQPRQDQNVLPTS